MDNVHQTNYLRETESIDEILNNDNNNNGTASNHHVFDDDSRNLESPGDVTSVASFYEDAVVFVTGGTGFVGKTLLEKLLRSCPGIKKIYVLMRPKRSLTVEQRYKELLKHQVFDRVRARWPERLGKLSPVSGDVTTPNLGITENLDDVTVFIHSAATVRFTEPLCTAIELNVKGTARALQLAKTMPKLKAFVHVSTAYSNAPRSHIEEIVYPPPYDPEVIVKCGQMLPVETVNLITERIQGDHPNTYTLTKALAESIVVQQKDLPVCIVRPSIVTAALHEPFPGWIDNIYGVTGLIMEISRGTYRTGYCKERYVVDLVPVDLVVNNCILAAWRTGTGNAGHCPVYNVTSGSINPLTWRDFIRLCVKWARENPTKYVMFYPNFAFTDSRFINTFWETTCHFLPAFIYDLMLRAQGRKAIMLKLSRRFKMAAATGEYFANNEWKFGICQLTSLHKMADLAKDCDVFPHWPACYTWEDYIGTYMMGIRKFILKDTEESLPQARSKLRRLYWIHKLLQAATGYYVFRMFVIRFR